MKKLNLLIGIFTLHISTVTSAAIIFDNNTTIDPSNATWNNTYDYQGYDYIILDDFNLTSDSVITDINYSIFTSSLSNYTDTYISIFDDFQGTELVSPFAVTGSLTSNGLISHNQYALNGFDINLSGLEISLAAGTYVLGVSSNMDSGVATIATGDTGYGSALAQDLDPYYYNRQDHMAFILEGNSMSVPEPPIYALMGASLIGFGFARRRRGK